MLFDLLSPLFVSAQQKAVWTRREKEHASEERYQESASTRKREREKRTGTGAKGEARRDVR